MRDLTIMKERYYYFLAFLSPFILSCLWVFFTDPSYIKSINGFTIITPDGYYYLDIIDRIINHQPIEDLNISTTVFCYLFAIPIKLFGIASAKDILFFIPPIFAGLFGVGTYLLSSLFFENTFALFASFLASSSIGLISRIKLGYFDTDIFVFVLPIFILYFAIKYVQNTDIKNLILSFLFSLLLSGIYQNGSILVLFCVAGFAVLLFTSKIKKNITTIILYLIAATFINPTYIFNILSKVKLYLLKAEDSPDLLYNSTFGFIEESSRVSFFDAWSSISGHYLLFILSVIGLIVLAIKKRETFVLFPFFALGGSAFILGSRFEPFAAVASAIGAISLMLYLYNRTNKAFIKYFLFGIFFILPFSINILNAALNNQIGGFHAKELLSLKQIDGLIEKNATIFSRWDYGYEIRYYLKANTPSNNGSMSGQDIFVESAAVSSKNQNFTANIILEADRELHTKNDANKTFFLKMANKHGFDKNHIENYLNYLENNRSTPSSKQIYLLLPTRMIDIYQTIQKNANASFMKGRINPSPYFVFYRSLFENNNTLKLDNHVFIDKNAKTVSIDGKKSQLSAIYIVKKDTQKTDVIINKMPYNSNLVLIYLQELNGYIISDKYSLDTAFVQMLIFDNYDKTRFEKLYDDRYFKLFRVL